MCAFPLGVFPLFRSGATGSLSEGRTPDVVQPVCIGVLRLARLSSLRNLLLRGSLLPERKPDPTDGTGWMRSVCAAALCATVWLVAPMPAHAEDAPTASGGSQATPNAPAAAEDAAQKPLTLSAEAVRNEGIRCVAAMPGTLAHMLPAMARVVPDTTHTVAIHPAGSGKVLSIAVLPGQPVRKGQALLQYQNHALHIARLQETQTRTALVAALAAQKEAAEAYGRARALAGTTVSAGESQRRQAALQLARENVAARQAELGVLEHRFQEEYTSATEEHAAQDETSTLVAPFDGTVTSLTTAIAADVDPALVLITVSDTQHVWIVSDVAPQDAALLATGGVQHTLLPAQDGSEPPPALISRMETIDTGTDPATGLVRVLSRVQNNGTTLRPGMVLNSLLQTTQQASGLVIPAEAVQTLDGQDTVFSKTAEGTFRPTPVTLGMEENGQALIRSGLKAGDQVVTHGSIALKGMVVLAGMDAD
ncbi:efflux RND transporter periplasmic adaptor subunit [Acetobacter tropicalis]|nr:efflux RND transporter periplasmic adaptor subunit [Acetobacter tropicalis]MDO8171217.1 efflux RND transporter periplasmic adaptor subunit [Acetobacter tropicalis]